MSTSIEDIVSLCKRRGFVYQSSEIYNGLSSAWDYGPLGVELKQNIANFWWKHMVRYHEEIVGIDASILMHPRVWEASGHVENFVDTMVEDIKTNERYRWDHLTEEERTKNISPNGNPLSKPRDFNLMFKTHIGSTEDSSNLIYLRPETAQGIYVNFKNVIQTNRKKIPFGIAQIGKAFRNEIVTKNFIFRTCEFEQLEMQYFVTPGEDKKWFEYWKDTRLNYYSALGIQSHNLQFHQHGKDELAHYALDAYDIEYHFPFGWGELEGIHNRGDYDLSRHMEYSRKDLSYVTDDGDKYTPYIIETSAGLTRSVLMVLCDAYAEETINNNETRTVLHLHPKIAPTTVAVFPLMKKEGMPEIAHKIIDILQEKFSTTYDASGAIGRRYRRQDEIGTPFCITVDYDTLSDNTVTVRFRDTMNQERISISNLVEVLEKSISDYTRV